MGYGDAILRAVIRQKKNGIHGACVGQTIGLIPLDKDLHPLSLDPYFNLNLQLPFVT